MRRVLSEALAILLLAALAATPAAGQVMGVIRKIDPPERGFFNFTNKTDKPVEKFWLDFDGKRKSYGKVGPGETDDIETFVTHAWLLADEGGKVLGIYVAERGVGRVVIEATSH